MSRSRSALWVIGLLMALVLMWAACGSSAASETVPKVILVDEPTAGSAKLLFHEVYQMLFHLRDREGLTILLVDRKIREALKIADYVYVQELGRNRFEGPATDFTSLETAFWGGWFSLSVLQ